MKLHAQTRIQMLSQDQPSALVRHFGFFLLGAYKKAKSKSIWTYDFASLILSPWRSRTIPRVLWLTANTLRQSVRLWSRIDPRTICLHQRKSGGSGWNKEISLRYKWPGGIELLCRLSLPAFLHQDNLNS